MSVERASGLDRDRAAYLRACELDILVAKPGNVSVASAGHGMEATMFRNAASATVGPLFRYRAALGARIESSVAAALAATGCNTNLGIVLLCAPIAAALEERPTARTAAWLRAAVERVIDRADVVDTRAVYRAIARANPGGLGQVDEEDVRSVPSVDLRNAMRLAAARDSIARQYANGFADVFDLGLPCFERAARTSPERAVIETYFLYLATWPDSHVVRKHGEAIARRLSREAAVRSGTGPADAPQWRGEELETWDAELKSRGINPGTSADLVVATAFAFEALRENRSAEETLSGRD